MINSTLHYVKLMVDDPEKLALFYAEVFGMEEVRRIHEPEHIRPHLEIFLSAGPGETKTQIALMKYLNMPTPKPGEAITAIMVKDVDAVVAAAEAGGGATVLPTETLEKYNNFTWAIITDPEGHRIEVMQSQN